MNKAIITLSFVLAFAIQALCQSAPGYLGQTRFAGCTIEYSPAYDNLFFTSKDNDPPSFFDRKTLSYKNKQRNAYLNSFIFSGFLELITKPHKSLYVGLAYQKRGINRDVEFSNQKQAFEMCENLQYSRYQALSLRFGKKFTSQLAAPIGTYFGWEMGMAMIQTQAVHYDQTVLKVGKPLDFFIGGTAGLRRALNDRLIIDLGVSMNCSIRGLFAFNRKENRDKYSPAEVIKYSAISSNALSNLLTSHLGLMYALH